MKVLNILFALATITTLFSCGEEDPTQPFDHAAQAIKDEVKLQAFLETHYYTPPTSTEQFGIVDTLTNGGQPSLLSQVITKEVTYSNVDFKLYYLKAMPEGVNENPTKVDSALVNYKGLLLTKVNNDFDQRTIFETNNNFSFWANLSGGVIPGWTHALPNFKSGTNTSMLNMPLTFENTGKGIIFLPSGLAYRNIGSASIPGNAPIMFHVEMAMISRNDQDRDGLLSIFENLDNDDDFTNDDTDNDDLANYVDFDDDNDGVHTKYENADINNDGNPNDAQDTDGDNTPNYLDDDDDGDGILTKDENVDPNNDGNPSDAKDTDGDDIPDYLDAN